MAVVFEKTKGLTNVEFHYCPGCTHGVIHRLVAEVMEELELVGKAIGMASVGCSGFCCDYFNGDHVSVGQDGGAGRKFPKDGGDDGDNNRSDFR